MTGPSPALAAAGPAVSAGSERAAAPRGGVPGTADTNGVPGRRGGAFDVRAAEPRSRGTAPYGESYTRHLTAPVQAAGQGLLPVASGGCGWFA